MTRLTPEAEAAIQLTGRAWIKYKTETTNVELRVRKRIQQETDAAIAKTKLEVAEAIRVALEAGATKVSLKAVTSKAPGTIEGFLALLDASTDEAAGTPIGELFTCEWNDGETLRITLDPAEVVSSPYDRDESSRWTGIFEVFTRPTDGKVFIDPIDNDNADNGVTEWLRADRANEEAVIAWATETPRAA